MLCYLDKTFCNFFDKCELGAACPIALTTEVERRADSCGLPICRFSEEPGCFKAKDKLDGIS